MNRIAWLVSRLAVVTVVMFAVVGCGAPDSIACDPDMLIGVTTDSLVAACGAPLYVEHAPDGASDRWVYREAWASVSTASRFLCVAITDGRVTAVLNRRDECTFEPSQPRY